MEEETHNTNGKSLMGIILGAMIGAGAAMLFAPKSGRDMRKDLRRKAEEKRGKMMEKAERAGDKAVEFSEQTRDKIKERANEARTRETEAEA